MKSKDAVNHFLKNTSRLTSIEERAEASSNTSEEEVTVRPIPTPRVRSLSNRLGFAKSKGYRL